MLELENFLPLLISLSGCSTMGSPDSASLSLVSSVISSILTEGVRRWFYAITLIKNHSFDQIYHLGGDVGGYLLTRKVKLTAKRAGKWACKKRIREEWICSEEILHKGAMHCCSAYN